jgi:hypothetical protein
LRGGCFDVISDSLDALATDVKLLLRLDDKLELVCRPSEAAREEF